MTDNINKLETSAGDPKANNPPQSTTRITVLHLCKCKVSCFCHAVSALCLAIES